MKPYIVSVVAKSGTGKTTLLEKLIPDLTGRGYRVGAVKHDAHRFEIDHEGKDSWRLTRAGAQTMVITSPEMTAIVRKNPAGESLSLEEIILKYCSECDIVLVEGFKKYAIQKIEVHRKAHHAKLLCRGEETDPDLIAVVSDEPLELDVPLFDINDVKGISDFIVARSLA